MKMKSVSAGVAIAALLGAQSSLAVEPSAQELVNMAQAIAGSMNTAVDSKEQIDQKIQTIQVLLEKARQQGTLSVSVDSEFLADK